MMRSGSWTPPAHVNRAVAACVLLLIQLVIVTATPLALTFTLTGSDAHGTPMVCNCIHDPGTTCPMHGGGPARPPSGSGPHWSGCDGMGQAAVMAMMTGIGIPAEVHDIAAPARTAARFAHRSDLELQAPTIPALPPPRT